MHSLVTRPQGGVFYRAEIDIQETHAKHRKLESEMARSHRARGRATDGLCPQAWPLRHRDAIMIPVAYRHGLRASEVCDLQWQQIELSDGHDTRALQHYLGHKNIQARNRSRCRRRTPLPFRAGYARCASRGEGSLLRARRELGFPPN